MKSRLHERRRFLRGIGATIALPFVESLMPRAIATETPKFPVRMGFLYVPNGVKMDDWTPKETGTKYELPAILKPLAPLRSDLLVLSGLAQDKGRPHGDGAGDHARSAASFLTSSHPVKTSGANIRAGISVDQVAAFRVGEATRYGSLELGCEKGVLAGNCDSGYSCAYSHAIAWQTPSTPLPTEVNPKQLFERLFAPNGDKDTQKARAARREMKKSILDFVRDDARDLQGKLGPTDRRKMDEYFESVRDVEKRISKAVVTRPVARPNYPAPHGVPEDYRDHLRIMGDLMVLAFQTDLTRICTFMFANEGSNKSYPMVGVSEGHHYLSHHAQDPKKLEKIRQINQFHVDQLAYILQKMKGVKEGDGSLLDHSMIVYGSGLGDGNAHNHDNLPVLLAGNANRTIATGRHIRFKNETPMANLFLSMLDRMNVHVDNFGDSTGRLKDLS